MENTVISLQSGASPTVQAHNVAKEISLNNFMSDVSVSGAFHYLDSRGAAVEGLPTGARLGAQKAVANDVSEPASEILLLAGLSALAIAIRRQSPS